MCKEERCKRKSRNEMNKICYSRSGKSADSWTRAGTRCFAALTICCFDDMLPDTKSQALLSFQGQMRWGLPAPPMAYSGTK